MDGELGEFTWSVISFPFSVESLAPEKNESYKAQKLTIYLVSVYLLNFGKRLFLFFGSFSVDHF
jgi:hypothetical protein